MVSIIASKTTARAAVMCDGAIGNVLTTYFAIIGIAAIARITAHATARAFSRAIIGSRTGRTIFPRAIRACPRRCTAAAFAIVHAAAAICICAVTRIITRTSCFTSPNTTTTGLLFTCRS